MYLKRKIAIILDKKFVNQFEHYGKRFEDYAVNPYKMEWEQKLLVMWHPEASAAIQLLDSVTSGEASNPFIYVPFELKDRSREELFAEVREKLGSIDGAVFEIGQPISHRMDMLLSGKLLIGERTERESKSQSQLREEYDYYLGATGLSSSVTKCPMIACAF